MFLMMTEGYDGDCARKERMREDRKKEIRTLYGNEVVRDFLRLIGPLILNWIAGFTVFEKWSKISHLNWRRQRIKLRYFW